MAKFGKGWHLESVRHGLAAKGIHTNPATKGVLLQTPFKLSPARQKELAIEIASEAIDYSGTGYWIGHLHDDEKLAEKEAAKYNQILQGTTAHARVEFARNYNMRGKDWGVTIEGFTEKVQDQIMAKYGFGQEDIYSPD